MEGMVTDIEIHPGPFRQKEKVEDIGHRLKKEPVQMTGEMKGQGVSSTQEEPKVGRG